MDAVSLGLISDSPFVSLGREKKGEKTYTPICE